MFTCGPRSDKSWMIPRFQSTLPSVPIARPVACQSDLLNDRDAVDAAGKMVVHLSGNGQRSGHSRTPCSASTAHILYPGISRRSMGFLRITEVISAADRLPTIHSTRSAAVLVRSQKGRVAETDPGRHR